MRKGFLYILLVVGMASLFSCQKKMICPAYQSYFILDTDETRRHFSLFGEDSLPKQNWEVDKKKVGIANAMAYNKKIGSMQTVSTESVYLPLKDPFADYEFEFAESDSIVSVDTAAVLSNYYNDFENVDQIIYLHHFGKYLPSKKMGDEAIEEDLSEVDKPLIDAEALREDEEPLKKKRKFWPFGKNKEKPPPDEELSN